MKLSDFFSKRHINNMSKNVKDTYECLTTDENMNIIYVIGYIVLVVSNKPVQLITLFKKPLIQIICLVYILYLFNSDQKLAIALAIAFIITITTTHPLSDIESTIPIINTEHFEDSNKSPNIEILNDEGDESDGGGESDDTIKHTVKKQEKGQVDSESDDDSSSSDEESDEDADEEEDSGENFLSKSLFKKGSVNDTFADLHQAIHKLESFISSNNSN